MKRTTYRNGDEISLVHCGCDGCIPCSVNGHLCHEAGCPDAWRDQEQSCFVCGCDFFRTEKHERICPDCARAEEPEEFADDEDRAYGPCGAPPSAKRDF